MIAVDPRYFRPTEVELLLGDATKAREKLGWEARTTVNELCAEMVAADLSAFRRDQVLRHAGFSIKNEFE